MLIFLHPPTHKACGIPVTISVLELTISHIVTSESEVTKEELHSEK